MPIINISIAGEPDPERSTKIAARLSELTQSHLRKDPSVTAIIVTYVDPRHWFAGGKSIASQQLDSFWLDIKVVDGTNTKQELAGYIEAKEFLGKLHPESYVLVHEVPAAAYGYGGKTQEFRYISGRLAAS
ncbi:4-oxalocrotonate tautomerase [Sinorhizobium medicae]|nr:4-oxalocrotonate tautomerase [Sinorhizobium medicae]MDX1057891.1 4-oxalocrotonate tautomerase [Sinorhizobium medicae]